MQIGDFNFSAGFPLDLGFIQLQDTEKQEEAAPPQHIPNAENPSPAPNPALPVTYPIVDHRTVGWGDERIRIKLPQSKKEEPSIQNNEEETKFCDWLELQFQEAVNGNFSTLSQFFKNVLNGVEDRNVISLMKRANTFGHIMNFPPQFFREFTATELREMSEWQNEDFEISSKTFFQLEPCAFLERLTDEEGMRFLKSNLGFALFDMTTSNPRIKYKFSNSWLLKFDNWFRLYNPLNLYAQEDLAEMLQEIVINEIGKHYNRFLPPDPTNPYFQSIEFPNGYNAPLGFYLVRFNLLDKFPKAALNLEIFFHKDYNSKFLFEYLGHLDEQQKEALISTCSNYGGYNIEFYMALINAHIEIRKGVTTSLASLLEMIERNQLWSTPLHTRNLFNECLFSEKQVIYSLIRKVPVAVFLFLKRNNPAITFTPEVVPLNLFDMIPIEGLESHPNREEALDLLETCLPKLIQIARIYVEKQLHPIRSERLEKLNQFLFQCDLFKKSHVLSSKYRQYLRLFPSALFAVPPGRKKSDNFLHGSFIKARQQKQQYRTTYVHWLCWEGLFQSWEERKNYSELQKILKQYPNALDWPDSNGDSINDLMKLFPRLNEWFNFNEKNHGGATEIALDQSSVPEPLSSETLSSAVWPLTPSLQKILVTRLRAMIREVSNAFDRNENFLSDRLISPKGAVGIESHTSLFMHKHSGLNAYLRVADWVIKKRMVIYQNHIKEFKEIFGDTFTDQQMVLLFHEGPLSDRQNKEVLGAIYHFKRLEFARMKKLRTFNELDTEIRTNIVSAGIRKVPVLIIRQESDRVHAEIITGHFTLGNQIFGVTQDPTGEMAQKIQSIVDVDTTFETNEEGDRMVKLTVEGMDRLLSYCKDEKGLNLLILPRIDVPVPKSSEMPQVRTRNVHEGNQEQEVAREVHKRASEVTLKLPKRIKISPEPIDPEIIPEAFEPTQKGVASLQEITTGKVEKDLDEMEEPNKGKRPVKELSPENLYIPAAPSKKQQQMALVASDDDPASFFKNMAFELIQETIEGVRNAHEIKNFLDRDGVDIPIEEKLKELPPMPKPFIFSNLYSYQENDLGRILQLQLAGIYPLISYRMGLGKTYLYVELLMQQLAAKPKGIHMVVVPKSVLSQACGDIHKGLANAKATCWRALWKSHPEQAQELMKKVLNSNDLVTLLPLLSSLDHVKDGYLLRFFLTKTRELMREKIPHPSPLYQALTELYEIKDQLGLKKALAIDLVNQIVQEASKMFVVVEQSTPIDPAQLSGLILFKEENIVEVESATKKKQASPFNPGCIVVTKYHQVGSLLERTGADQLDSITLDEAQKVNRKGTVLHTHIQKLIQKQKNPHFSKSFLTATPLENSFEEPATLLELANPEFFPASTFNALSKLVGMVDNQVTNILMPDAFDLQTAVKVFVEHFRLKKVLQKTVILLTQKEAARRYGAKFPKPIKRDHRVPFSVSEKQKVDAVTKLFAGNNKLGLFDFVTQINKILTHDLFENQALSTKSDAFANLTKRIATGEVDAVIEESFMLRTLFSSGGFAEVFGERKKGLLVLDNIAPGELIRLAANQKYGDYCRFYEGSLSTEQRLELVNWFNEDVEEPRLLILSLEAGGVGLNLPKADLVISATRTYNPGQADQAQARAFRFGYEGEKPVYRIIYENSLFSVHLDTIHKIKKLWVKALFKPQESYKAEFALWMQTRVAEASKLLLNFNKESENFESDVAEIQGWVDAYCEGVREEYLQDKIDEAIPPSLVRKTFKAGELERIPIPYGLSREDVALFTYAYQIPLNDPRLNALKQNAFNSWFFKKMVPEKLRTPEQSGFPNYRKHIQAVIDHMKAHMKALDLELPKSFPFIAQDAEKIECTQWPETLDPSKAILLYQRQGIENQPHFEALIRKTTAIKLELQIRR